MESMVSNNHSLKQSMSQSMSQSLNTTANKKNSICRYFAMDGICFYGEECQFVHSMARTQRTAAQSEPSMTNMTPHLPQESRLPTYLQLNNGSASMANAMSNTMANTMANTYYANDTMSAPLSALAIDAANSRRKLNNTQSPALESGMSPILSQTQAIPAITGHYFVADNIKQEILHKLSVTLESCANGDMYLPSVDVYEDLMPLETSQSSPSSTFNGLVTSVYRATNMKCGQTVTLRRVHAFQPSIANAKTLLNCIELWKKLKHSNIVQLRQVFTTKAFGDNSVVFVYDYHAGAETLMNQYFANQSASGVNNSVNGYATSSRPYSQQQSQRKLLPEGVIWNYIIQLSSALRAIHANGLASRAIDPTKIIITNGNTSLAAQPTEYPRLRLSGCGIFDVLTHESFLQANNPKVLISHFQQEDLVQFGKLCLVLASNSLTAGGQRDNWQTSLELISRHYSPDLRSLIVYLLSYKPNSGTTHTINDIMPMIGARFYTQLDLLYQRDDTLIEQLTKEIDNGRILRLLTKLGSINERPEFQLDPNWSETGDRYMLKLFRDYLFHQFSEDGRPWLDLAHIVTTLNKLDIGSLEKICLISRDEQNILIVTFAELKRCLDSSMNELML